ncbi:HAD-like protein [Dendrothele bispora CBS 962.96]|uniref:HAD-like protein n=1 Tax=Dendrothele bispora (strain CBS 962.96) TaxID=1314807 RepID=A0A4S8MXQ8_DENBC|nr:HAD-like protein [Dendrothele bispora CBS 962.96]
MSEDRFKAVIFDIGGVVMRSPFIAITQYEKRHGIPNNYLNCSIVARGSQGAWQKFERGELELFPFYEAFSRDLSDIVNGNVWYKAYCKRKGIQCPKLPESLNVNGRELFGAMMQASREYDPYIREAIRRIRAAGRHKIIALTNNFSRTQSTPIPASELAFLGWDEGAAPQELRDLFDDFCDSSTLGTRKPEPQFYLIACERNGIRPHEAVFLDDIGLNLKAAKNLGMETIHVPIGGTLNAVKELERRINLVLTNGTSKL